MLGIPNWNAERAEIYAKITDAEAEERLQRLLANLTALESSEDRLMYDYFRGDEDDEDDEGNEWSVVDGGDTLRPIESNEDTLRPALESALDAVVDAQGSDKGDEEEEEDSEEEYEEGEFDAVGGGPTRWIRGALIGMGSFGSVYLGMNRTSGELMAVKQVELPSHEVQGEQRKQSMLIALQREIALLRDLTHENIVHYIGIPPPGKRMWLIGRFKYR